MGRTWGGETRNEKKKDKEREKHTRYSRQRGETIKNTDTQIKTEAERGGSRHLESKMLRLQRGWGKQESRGRGGGNKGRGAKDPRTRPFPSRGFSLSPTLSRRVQGVSHSGFTFRISARVALSPGPGWCAQLPCWPQLMPCAPTPLHRSLG